MGLQILILFMAYVMTVLSEVTTGPSVPDKRIVTKDKDSTQLSEEEFACPEKYTNFCINGGCIFHKGLDIPICRCVSGFTGERCEHVTLPVYLPESEVTYIAIGILVGLLLSGLIVFIWCYKEKRCKPTPDYETCNRENTP
ncbi:epigen [Aquarana catesbeiana]|uniref:epigen n=1 Tax=Aquarana catesbeiana TaxID=8400 RepID=UPI003CC98D0D